MFNPEEFKNLKLKVFGLPDGTDIRYEFKALIDEQLPTFWEYNDADVNKVIKYIVYLYDKNSPMQIRFPDIKARRNQCAILAGFTGAFDTFEDLHTLERGSFQEVVGHEPKDEDGKEEPIYGDSQTQIARTLMVSQCLATLTRLPKQGWTCLKKNPMWQ